MSLTVEEWARFDDCVICSAPARTPCLAIADPHNELHRPHGSRTARVERTPGGKLLLAPAGPSAALHVALAGGTAVCSGAELVMPVAALLDDTVSADRCHRPSCARIWKAEAWR